MATTSRVTYHASDDLQIDMTTSNQRMKQINFLTPNAFRFSIDKTRYENVSFLVQRVNLPGINIGAAEYHTPWRSSNYVHADKADYGDLTISFLVDEDLINYQEIHDWLLAQINNQDNYPKDHKRRDIKLTIMSSHNNPRYTITFIDAFPTGMSDIQFDSSITDADYVTVDVSFKYSYYLIEKV